MSAPKKQTPADVTRIALNEQEIRVWRRSFHAEPRRAEASAAKIGSKPSEVERSLRSAAHAVFAKMGED